jgi:hypothetical protein
VRGCRARVIETTLGKAAVGRCSPKLVVRDRILQPPVPASATGGGIPAATAHAPGSFVAAQMAAAPPLHPDWQLGSVLLILPLLSTEQQ